MKIAAVLLLFVASACQAASVTIIAKNVTAEVGEDVTIPCDYESDSTFSPTKTWYAKKDDGTQDRLYVWAKGDEAGTFAGDDAEYQRTPALTIDDLGNLVFGKVTLEDNRLFGKLHCTVELQQDGLAGKDIGFIVALLPREDATVDIENYDEGKQGFDLSEDNTNIGNCMSAKSYPPAAMMFYENGIPIVPKSAFDGLAELFNAPTLTESGDGWSMFTSKDLLKKIEISDHQAEFICNVKTVYGDKVFERNYTMPKFNVNYQTQTASFKSEPDAYLGEDIRLSCSADGFPTPTISIDDVDGEELTVTVTEDLNGKSYVCKAYNNELQADNPIVSSPYVLNVMSLAEPTFVGIEDKAAAYKIGDSISVNCSSAGNPAPMYAWYQGDKKVSDSGLLTIESASLSDTGEYNCRVTNGHQNLNKDSTLAITVNGISTVGEETQDVEGEEGKEVNLECSVSANPKPTFTWTADGKTVSGAIESTPGNYKYTSQLKVGPLNTDLSKKEYVCTASGHDQADVSQTFVLPEVKAGSSTAIIIVILVLILVVAVVLAVLYNKGIICKKSEEKGDESAEMDLEGGMNNEEGDAETGNGNVETAVDNEDRSGNPEEEKLMASEE